MYIHMERNNLKRKSAKKYPWRRENKRELLKASNETQKPQKKERKKLSPEARKRTRASESLKMTSKSQLYFSMDSPPPLLGAGPPAP